MYAYWVRMSPSRAVIRELGKVFGLPKEEIDQQLEGSQLKMIKFKSRFFTMVVLSKFPSAFKCVHAGGMLIGW